MQTQWKEWLAAERAAGRTGRVLTNPPIVRGQAYPLVLPIPGDWSAADFSAALFVGPDAALDPVASFTVDVGVFDAEAGTTTVTLTLAASATGDDLPPDSDFNGLSEVVFKLDCTLPGESAARAMGLVIPIVE